MEAKLFNLKGMIRTDLASCLPLEPYMMSISDMLEAQGYGNVDIERLKKQLINLIKLNTGEYKAHVENGVTFVHGVGVDKELFVQMPSNSIGLIDHTQSVEWFNLMNNDDADFHGKGRFMYMLGMKKDEDGDVFHGYIDGNCSSRFEDEEMIKMRKEFFCIFPCLRPDEVNIYLMERYQCYVSVIMAIDDVSKPDEGNNVEVNYGYRAFIQQSVFADRPLVKDCGTKVNDFYNVMFEPVCSSSMGAYSMGFKYIYEKIIEYSLRFS